MSGSRLAEVDRKQVGVLANLVPWYNLGIAVLRGRCPAIEDRAQQFLHLV